MSNAQAVNTAPAGWYPDPGDARFVRYWDGHTWTEHAQPAVAAVPQVAVVNMPPRKINHILHLLLSFLTMGLWIPVWIILAIVNASKK